MDRCTRTGGHAAARRAPQDPVRHHRPAALRHARLQRRHARPHAGDRRARRGGAPLRAGAPAVGRVHAVAVDDDHRPAPEHARRVDERRAAARRRAVGRDASCTTPGTARRSSASRTSSRSSIRSRGSPRTGSPATALCRAAPRVRALRGGDPRRPGPAPLRALARRRPPRGRRDVLPGARRPARGERDWAAATPARRRCTTTRSRRSGTTPTGSPTGRSPGSTRSQPTTTGSAG